MNQKKTAGRHGEARHAGLPALLLCFLAYALILFAGIQFINAVVPASMLLRGICLFALSALAVATPLGEELAFQGKLTLALVRLHPWICVLAGALIIALTHGLNAVSIMAFIAGFAVSYLAYRKRFI